MRQRWDIFCRVIDNFGDIGVCWRLAKQLAHERGLQVRLYVDDLNVAKQLIPKLDVAQQIQLVEHVSIQHWQTEMVFGNAVDVVIAAFACELPQAYLANKQSSTVWVNLEYLSAEPWVETSHLLPSPNAQFALIKELGLIKHFYFPGFTQNTGGLLREHGLIARRQVFQQSESAQREFWQQLGVIADDSLKISLFCYAYAPLQALFYALAGGIENTTLLVPFNKHIQKLASFFGKKSLNIGDKVSVGQLTLQVLPFLSQDDYDMLLWACDINFVRGEDSWVRAIWAGKPFVWQPYWQSENTHITKLNAFLQVFYADCDNATKQVIVEAYSAWVAGDITYQIWQHYLDNLPAIKTVTKHQSDQLAAQVDLAAKLVIFCNA